MHPLIPGLLFVCSILLILFRPKQKVSCAPGPPSIPIIGNIFRVNLTEGAWKVFTRMKAQYGDIIFFHGLGTNILVLNSLKAVNDLLEKNGTIYSHRPVFTVAGELMGLDQSLALIPYGKEWREHRKLANIALSSVSVQKYRTVQEDLSALLIRDILINPGDFFKHVRLSAARVVMSVTYGFSVDTDDKYITHAEKTMEIVTTATVPGAFLCDFLPFMKHLPKWVPFMKEAAHGKFMIDTLVDRPFEQVKSELVSGTAVDSLARDLFSLGGSNVEFDHRIKWILGTMYGAGGEATYATVLTFIMAMALHTEKQKKAQEEIDLVVGTERVPTIADLPNLPYVKAVIKETMRWNPAFPLGVARRSSEGYVYEGHFIPKGTIVMPNIWAIASEPNSKYDPREFIPERFMDSLVSTIDPAAYAFGFGRRYCPGRFLADNSVSIMISTILAAFDIFPPANQNLKPNFSLNMISYPKPFDCRIVPRSENASRLIIQRAAHCQENSKI
ncbi:cytochrome P450 [Lentinula aciculospora]|uniref:Cytochrome P450 n=1 Tax=Lentinula aciculospora TaxID=153920 RepID=A0A9W9ABY0_9AGAR|nr:cytochrome P450 [Lentinula aciculospora]KAJ4487577.1 cytochrome P450 [Lentinula aciculospora]